MTPEARQGQSTGVPLRSVSVATRAPASASRSAKNTLWGALQAVTFDVDHQKGARSQDNRLNSAWFGPGEQIKRKALQRTLAMVA